MSTEVLVVRHGQTFGNVDELFCGHSETELTPLGIAQARALGRRLANETIDVVVASDLSRAADTARHVVDGRGLEITLDPRLREMYYGDWEALPGKELIEKHPEVMREFFLCQRAAPGGESVRALRERTSAALQEIASQHRGRKVLVVSHGNAIMALVAESLAMPEHATWSFAFENTSLTRLHVSNSGRVTVRSLNDASHIEGLTEATA